MSFDDRAALARELTDNLALGRAFVAAQLEVPVLSECVLVLVHPERGDELRLRAQVVMLNAGGALPGVGLALTAFDASVQQRLREFAQMDPPESAAGEPAAAASEDSGDEQPADDSLGAEPQPESETPEALDAPLTSSRPPNSELQVEDRQRRLRQLNAMQQIKLARTGELADRVALERLYGKHVWDALLHNPKLSIPEVARIARKGTVPKPLLELILENAAWTKADAVRRALLGNPKLGPEAVLKLLRATPKAELKLIEKGTAYGAAVRESARKLLRQ